MDAIGRDDWQLAVRDLPRAEAEDSTFSVFVRALPPGYGFLVVAGLENALEFLELNAYHGDVWAMPEGTIAFPGEPILQLTGPMRHTKGLARAVARCLSFQTAAASKAARTLVASRARPVIDVSASTLGPAPAQQATRAAAVAGIRHTTNITAAECYGLVAVDVPATESDEVALRRIAEPRAPAEVFGFGPPFPVLEMGVDLVEDDESPHSALSLEHDTPNIQQVYRFPACNGDVVAFGDEPAVLYARPLLVQVMTQGRPIGPRDRVERARARCEQALALLPDELRDLEHPPPVDVACSEQVRRVAHIPVP